MRLNLEARLAIVVAVLLGTYLLLRSRDSQEIVPPMPSQALLPANLEDWRSVDVPIDPDSLKVLGPGSFLSREYFAPRHNVVSLFVAYFPTQREGDAIHSPKNCLPGAGWTPTESAVTTLNVGSEQINANRYVVAQGTDRQLVLYWYQAHGRTVASEYSAKYWLIADSIRLHRTDGGLVRLVTPMLPGETSVAAQERALEFLRPLLPKLNAYLPA